jgi:protein-disulfide isomerase
VAASLAILLFTVTAGHPSFAAKKLIAAVATKQNPAKQKSVLIVYSDYQCSACRKFNPILQAAKSKYGNRLQVILKNYPLPMHKNAMIAALAAESAGLQGKLWPMHDKLYSEQASWIYSADPVASFTQFAKSLNLNVPKFISDLRSGTVKGKVATDMRSAAALGLTETPTVFLNGKGIAAISLSKLDKQINESLR